MAVRVVSLGGSDPVMKKAYELPDRCEWDAKTRPGSHWMLVRTRAEAAAIAI
jgi:hypothetical protein